VIFLVSIVVFIALHILPGDPIYMLMTSEELNTRSEAEIQAVREQFGLDKPIIVQYFNWLGGIAHGDFGESIRYRFSVGSVMWERIPLTLHLGILAFIVAHVLGITAGIICAVRRGTWLDTIITILANAGITIPIFWLGIMLIYVFSIYLQWLPVMGYTSPFTDFWLSTKQLIMPVMCLAILPMASAARQTRSSMLEVMHMDYIRTAWSKGLAERVIILKHALKNGLLPVLTLAGLQLSGIIGGSVLIETVFAIPGMGRLAVESLFARDYLVIQGVTVVIAGVIILVNLIVDIGYGWFDPRVRYR
jgi:peptide/nickel transport system permease protein